jgi:hypothetical protein
VQTQYLCEDDLLTCFIQILAASLADKSWAELSTEEQEAAIQDLATKKGPSQS